jgi:hypothetical protein
VTAMASPLRQWATDPLRNASTSLAFCKSEEVWTQVFDYLGKPEVLERRHAWLLHAHSDRLISSILSRDRVVPIPENSTSAIDIFLPPEAKTGEPWTVSHQTGPHEFRYKIARRFTLDEGNTSGELLSPELRFIHSGLYLRLVLLTLLSKDAKLRRNARATLLVHADPRALVEAAVQEYDQSGRSEILLHLRGILEDLGTSAWGALEAIAATMRNECELFVATIIKCPGVPDREMLRALRDVAANPSREVRAVIFEYLDCLPSRLAVDILHDLATDTDPEIAEDAVRLLS